MWEFCLNGNGGFEGVFILFVSVIECIEVVCGLMFLFYGFDVMGGVVNIIIKNMIKEWIGLFFSGFIVYDKFEFGDGYYGDFFVLGLLISNVLGL